MALCRQTSLGCRDNRSGLQTGKRFNEGLFQLERHPRGVAHQLLQLSYRFWLVCRIHQACLHFRVQERGQPPSVSRRQDEESAFCTAYPKVKF